MNGRGYKVLTLGCRTNRFESDALVQTLEEEGYVQDEHDPAVVVVNTCTVTHRADQQSRQLIRKCGRENPEARLIVTGCLAQLEARELKGIEGVDLVMSHPGQARFREFLEGRPKEEAGVRRERIFRDWGDLAGTLARGGRTRALLKVQDGCDNACSYCRVRLARGPSRSLPLERALDAACRLSQAGHKEIVLTGIHLGGYGADLEPRTDLTALVQGILALDNGPRLRLSSLDPAEVSQELLETVLDSDRFCPHFHLPLQSGDPGVLKRMNRGCTPREFVARAERILRLIPGAAVGADVIVGFPGEDEAAFENTENLIAGLDLAYLHVFPFSPRPGTPANSLKPRVEPSAVKERAARLRDLGRQKKEAFLNRLKGRSLEMLVESRRDQKSGLLTGVSREYAGLLLEGGDDLVNELVLVRGGEVRRGRVVVDLFSDSP